LLQLNIRFKKLNSRHWLERNKTFCC